MHWHEISARARHILHATRFTSLERHECTHVRQMSRMLNHDAVGADVHKQVRRLPLDANFVHIRAHDAVLALPRDVELHLHMLLARAVLVDAVRDVVPCLAVAAVAAEACSPKPPRSVYGIETQSMHVRLASLPRYACRV
jgi:hypothetical protein